MCSQSVTAPARARGAAGEAGSGWVSSYSLHRISMEPQSVGSSAAASKLAESAAGAVVHLGAICEFSLNRPPIRPKIDRQSYDELRPGVERAIALLEWFNSLQQNFANFVSELSAADGPPSAEQLALIARAIDACVVLENQFSGWSACINRFSWFKRTFAQLRRELAGDVAADQLAKDLPRFQSFIGAPSHSRTTSTAHADEGLHWREPPHDWPLPQPADVRASVAPFTRRERAISDRDAYDGATTHRPEEAAWS